MQISRINLVPALTDMGCRVDFYVMPLLILGFLALQLDRGNM
jgi:hypothetical protein